MRQNNNNEGLKAIPEPITELIDRVRKGDQEARTRLWNLIFPILKVRAEIALNGNNVAGVMRPSDLVQDASLQLLAHEKEGWKDRNHLIAFAVMVMRHIVIDRARGPLGKARVQVQLDESSDLIVSNDVSWVEVDEILTRLAASDPNKARVVELRLYGGLTNQEIAEVMEISVATVKRHLTFSRAFIMAQISETKNAKQ